MRCFYGWVVAATCGLLRLNSVKVASSEMMTFVLPGILADPAVQPRQTATQLMAVYSVANVVAACSSPFFGRMADVHGCRRTIPLGCVLLALSLLLLSAASSTLGFLGAFTAVRLVFRGALEVWT